MTRGRLLALSLTVGLPTLAQGYLLGLLALPFCRDYRFDGPLLVADWRPWVAKRWRYCTTIAAFQGRPSWFSVRTDRHEDEHFLRYLDFNALGAAQAGALAGVLGWWAFLWWGASGALYEVPGFVTAVVRYKRRGVSWLDAAYYGHLGERHAYSLTKSYFDGEQDRWEH